MNEEMRNILKKLMNLYGDDSVSLSIKSKVTQPTISRFLAGKHQEPKSSTVKKLANAYGLTESQLKGDSPLPEGMYIASTIEKRLDTSVFYNSRPIKIFGEIQAGDNGFLNVQQFPEGIDEGYVLSPVNGNNCYALRVRGDSMHPRIKHGEIILINPDQDVRSGNEVVVNLKDGRQMVKVYLYERDGEVTLSSVNKSHEDVIVKLDDIDQMHYVAAILPRDSVLRRG